MSYVICVIIDGVTKMFDYNMFTFSFCFVLYWLYKVILFLHSHFFRTLTTDITFHLFYIRSLNFVLLLWLQSYMQYIIISSSSVTAQAGKLKFFGTHPNRVVSYIAYTKFHSPRPIFHSPGQIFTRIGERASTSLPGCSRQNLLCSEFHFVLHTFAFIIGFILMT